MSSSLTSRQLRARLTPAFLACSRKEFLEKLSFVDIAFPRALIHIDVLDGTFVKNTCWAPPKSIARMRLSHPFEIHLMVKHPERHVAAWKRAGAQRIIFHYEAVKKPKEVINQLHDASLQASLALDLGTSVRDVRLLLPLLDDILVMGIPTGFTGQTFSTKTFATLRALRRISSNKTIRVDGGVTKENACGILDAGADRLIATSAVYPPELLKKYEKNLCHYPRV